MARLVDSVLSEGANCDITKMVESLNDKYGVNEASKILAGLMSEDVEFSTPKDTVEADVSAPKNEEGEEKEPITTPSDITEEHLNKWKELLGQIQQFSQAVKGTKAEQYIPKVFNEQSMQQFTKGLEAAVNAQKQNAAQQTSQSPNQGTAAQQPVQATQAPAAQ